MDPKDKGKGVMDHTKEMVIGGIGGWGKRNTYQEDGVVETAKDSDKRRKVSHEDEEYGSAVERYRSVVKFEGSIVVDEGFDVLVKESGQILTQIVNLQRKLAQIEAKETIARKKEEVASHDVLTQKMCLESTFSDMVELWGASYYHKEKMESMYELFKQSTLAFMQVEDKISELREAKELALISIKKLHNEIKRSSFLIVSSEEEVELVKTLYHNCIWIGGEVRVTQDFPWTSDIQKQSLMGDLTTCKMKVVEGEVRSDYRMRKILDFMEEIEQYKMREDGLQGEREKVFKEKEDASAELMSISRKLNYVLSGLNKNHQLRYAYGSILADCVSAHDETKLKLVELRASKVKATADLNLLIETAGKLRSITIDSIEELDLVRKLLVAGYMNKEIDIYGRQDL